MMWAARNHQQMCKNEVQKLYNQKKQVLTWQLVNHQQTDAATWGSCLDPF
jgi:hypothetical protein